MNKIVRENIEFKRGQSSKEALDVGDVRLQPTIYGAQYTRTPNSTERMARLEELGEEYDFAEDIGYYDVFLVDKNLPIDEVVNIFEKSEGSIEMPFETIGTAIGVIEQNAMGQYDFHVIEINKEDWKEWNIEDLRILSPDGETEDIDITAVV